MRKEIEYLSVINRQIKSQSDMYAHNYKGKKMCIIFLAPTVKSIIMDKLFTDPAKIKLKERISQDHPAVLTAREDSLIKEKLRLADYSEIGTLGSALERATLEKEIRPVYPSYQKEVLPDLFIERTLYIKRQELPDSLMLMIVDKPKDILENNNLEIIKQFMTGKTIDKSWEDKLMKQI